MSDNGKSTRCVATTRAGSQCKNNALDGSIYCAIHQTLPEPTTVEARSSGDIVLELGAETAAYQNGSTPHLPQSEPVAQVEELPSGSAFRARLAEEVKKLVERLQVVTPGFVPAAISPLAVYDTLEKMLGQLPEQDESAGLAQLQKIIREDVFDPEFWQGVWFLISYQMEMQVDFAKRRLTGQYETDEWGHDPEVFDAFRPFLDFLYHYWFRVSVTGIHNIPKSGRALVVSNHSGQLPFDGGMIMMAILNEHPSERLLRSLYATWFPTLPLLSIFLEKIGQVMASNENGVRLLENDELVGVYPEGFKGVGKLFKDRYKLARFGRGGFVRMALSTQSPIIPVSVVGAEEMYVSVTKSDLLARLTGFPYFPISLRFPWLGLLGVVPFPTKWYIDFGEPIPTDTYEPAAAQNLVLISQFTNQTRNVIQEMINTRLAMRQSVFRG